MLYPVFLGGAYNLQSLSATYLMAIMLHAIVQLVVVGFGFVAHAAAG